MSLGVASAGTSKPISVSTSTLSAVAIATWAAATPSTPWTVRLTWSSVTESAYAPLRSSTCVVPVHAATLSKSARARAAHPPAARDRRCGRSGPAPPPVSSHRCRAPASQAANSGITSPCIAQSSSVAESSVVVVRQGARTAASTSGVAIRGRAVHRQPAAQHVVAVRRQPVAAPHEAGDVDRARRGRSAAAGAPSRRRGDRRRAARSSRCRTPLAHRGARDVRQPVERGPQRARHRGGPGADDADAATGHVDVHRIRAAVQDRRRAVARRPQVCRHAWGRAHRDLHRTDASARDTYPPVTPGSHHSMPRRVSHVAASGTCRARVRVRAKEGLSCRCSSGTWSIPRPASRWHRASGSRGARRSASAPSTWWRCSAPPSSSRIVMGLDPNLAIMFSGICTILFLLITSNKVPELPRDQRLVRRWCRRDPRPGRGLRRRHRRDHGGRPGAAGGRRPRPLRRLRADPQGPARRR